jgi:hypothetical protein
MANEQPESTPPAQLESRKKLAGIKWEEISKSLEETLRMSETAWAMAGFSSLEEALRDLLEAFFVDDEKAAQQMLHERGLAMFRATELAFLLGLLSARERELVHLLRKIRNEFAHKVNFVSLSQASFSQSPMKELCLQLDEVKIIQLERVPELSEPATRFMNSCAFLCLVLMYRREEIEHREEAQSITEDEVYTRISKMTDPAR